MPYIKISDPNIIDLAAWQQVVNVVNQHSDSISSITNNFGLLRTAVTDWNVADGDVYEEFNSGTQKILFGVHRIRTSGDNKDSTFSLNRMFHEEIEYANSGPATTTFAAKPLVVASISLPRTDVTPMVDINAALICTVIGVTEAKFTVRIVKAREFDPVDNVTSVANPIPNGTFNVNWIAIGPK